MADIGSFIRRKLDNFQNQVISNVGTPIRQGIQNIASNPPAPIRQIGQNIANTNIGNLVPLNPVRNNPLLPTVGEYVQGQIVKPIQNAIKPQNNTTPIQKVTSAAQVIGAGFNATPAGALYNIGMGTLGGAARALRMNTPITQSIKKGISEPTSLAQQGLGIQNSALALGIDVAAGNPRAIIKGVKNVKGITQAMVGVNPKAFDLHPDDAAELGAIGEKLFRKIPLNKQENATLERSFKYLFPKIDLNKTSNAKLQQIIAATLDRYNQIPKGEMTPFPKMGFVSQSPIEPPHPGKLAEPPLPLTPPKKISALRQGLDRVRNVIESQGEAGKQLGKNLQNARDLAETKAGDWVLRMPTVRKLSKEEFENFVDVAEGNATAMNPKVASATNEWNTVRSEVYNSARESGLDIGKLENYFPHVFDASMFKNKDKYNQAINHLVETGQAENTKEAVKLLSYAQDVVRNRKHGNLEFERIVDLPGYLKNKEALFGYIEKASDRIAQAQFFGSKDEKALALIDQIARDGGDAATVKSLFDIASGAKKYGSLQQKISTGLRAFNTATKLGTGAITNAGQSVNTATVTGAFRTLLNAPKAAFSKEAKDFALKAGVTLDGVLQELREGSGFSGKVLGNIAAPGFNKVERFNRTLAAIAGRDYARELARKGNAKALAKMGVTLKGNALTLEQEIQAARNIVERTQFRVDPQDLPGWASSPWGKVIAQFRSFGYNQSAFMLREVVEPALQGNIAPLTRFIAIGIPVGIGIQTTKNILRNRKDEEDPGKRIMQGFNQVGGLGLAGDIYTGLSPMNKSYLDQNRQTTQAVSTLLGPTAGTLLEGYGALTNAVNGKPENLGRFTLRQVPLVGSTLQNTVLPYKKSSGETSRRYDLFGSPASAEDQKPVKTTLNNEDYVGKANTEKKIKELKAKEKEVLEKTGGIFGIGAISDEEKNRQIADLRAQQEQLQNSISTKDEKAAIDDILAEIELNKDRLDRANDFNGYMDALDMEIQARKEAQALIDKDKDKGDWLKAQNKIEDLQAKMEKYKSQGGFKKPKKLKVQKISAPSIRIPKIKTPKPKKVKLKKVKINFDPPKRRK